MTFQQLLNTKQFKQALHAAEKMTYLSAYAYCGGNQSQTAKLLGTSRGTTIKKLKQHGVI